MDTAETRSPLRILAPVALVIFGLALVLIISSANGGGGGGGTSSSSAEKARPRDRQRVEDEDSQVVAQRQAPEERLHREERRHARFDLAEGRGFRDEAPGAQPQPRPVLAGPGTEDPDQVVGPLPARLRAALLLALLGSLLALPP